MIGATPQIPKAFAEETTGGIKVLKASLQPEAIEGEFIIQFKTNKSLNNIKNGQFPDWLSKLGKDTKVDTSLSDFQIAHVTLANPASSGQWENLADIMSSDPDVYMVEPNYLYYALNASPKPNDPFLDRLWYLDKIDAFNAWPLADNSENITVAVVDSGMMFNHEDLRGRIWINRGETPDNGIDDDQNGFIDDMVGWNFYNNNNMPYATLQALPQRGRDENGNFVCQGDPDKKGYPIHATHVAGTIAAMNDNAIGIAGVAPNVKIMVLQGLGGPCGSGRSIDILRATVYAAENGAKIINMSLGGYGNSQIAQKVHEDLDKRGILVIAAAGNEGNNNDGAHKSYPASYPFDGIISVAASDENDQLTEFSNYGAQNVDLAAPGIRILSTIPHGNTTPPQSTYMSLDGTSMATPVVSGAAAVLWAHSPKSSHHEIKRRLLASVDRREPLATKVLSGGRLNLYRAITGKENNDEIAKAPTRPNNQNVKENNIDGIRLFDARENAPKAMKW